MKGISLPELHADFSRFLEYLGEHQEQWSLQKEACESQTLQQKAHCLRLRSFQEFMRPFLEYESRMRKIFAQQPSHLFVDRSCVVELFDQETREIKAAITIQPRISSVKELYIMPIADENRAAIGSPATVSSLKQFRRNFDAFSQSSLSELKNWSNIVIAGSAAAMPLLPIPGEDDRTLEELGEYYHQQLAATSDVDLFLYDLSDGEAIEKIKMIESSVKKAWYPNGGKVITARSKNAITFIGERPRRHIQIVLRLYRTISEILTGFDIDCACVAYDGNQVFASPRALSALMTRCNQVDLSRRSPSYESRLAKYALRGFEIFWSRLERHRINEEIYYGCPRYDSEGHRNQPNPWSEVGLARLLILEYLGREGISAAQRKDCKHGRLENHGEYHSNYNTYTIPYGSSWTAERVREHLLTADFRLNCRRRGDGRAPVGGFEVHRHPFFIGTIQEVIGDWCTTCPKPDNELAVQIAKAVGMRYVSGKVEFQKDDPGRQAIGSFSPLKSHDWAVTAYVQHANSANYVNGSVCQHLKLQSIMLRTEEFVVASIQAYQVDDGALIRYLSQAGTQGVSRMLERALFTRIQSDARYSPRWNA